MNKHFNFQNYLSMAENDTDFLQILTHQSIIGLEELKSKYQSGMETQDIMKLRSIIHKVKPTLTLLDADILMAHLEEAKQILGEDNLDTGKIIANMSIVNQIIEEIIKYMKTYLKTNAAI